MDLDVQSVVKKAIADGLAFQRRYGRSPAIVVKKHHDHVNALLNGPETTGTNWPHCLRCGTIVHGFRLAHDGDTHVTMVLECHGEETSLEVRKPYKDVNEVEPDWLREVVSMMAVFG